jgi:phosphoglycolate phosphatase-like HAD superfamily hydrolase
VDTDCYARAASERLGTQISTNWTEYRESTDSGILRELFDRYQVPPCRRPTLANDVRGRFFELLREAFNSDPECCREVAGAGALLQRLRDSADVRVAIATGGWSTSARLKLNHAGIMIDGIPVASADDSDRREEILRIALERSSAQDGLKFSDVTYVGDGKWDIECAAALDFNFVGIACEGGRDLLSGAGADLILDHFVDHDHFIRHVCAG